MGVFGSWKHSDCKNSALSGNQMEFLGIELSMNSRETEKTNRINRRNKKEYYER